MKKYPFRIFLSILLLISCKKEITKTNNQWNLKEADFEKLLELSDTSTLADLNQANDRLAEIQDIFSFNGDRRGTYTTILKALSNSAISSFELEGYKNTKLMKSFYFDFIERYLGTLHEQLLGNKLEYHWDTFYRHAKVNQGVSRLVLEGINAHFTIDMAYAVAKLKLNKSNQTDWDKFGNETVDAVSSFTDELNIEYEVDATDVFKLFSVGDLINGLLGEGSATKFGYQYLRNEALSNGMLLQISSSNAKVEANIKMSFFQKDNTIISLDRMGLLP